MNSNFIFQKVVDKSLLYEGMTIPVDFQDVFYSTLGFKIERGQQYPINLIINNVKYPAILKNLNFDEKKYPNHKDLLQIRYSHKSAIAVNFREIFSNTNEVVSEFYFGKSKPKKVLSIAPDQREYVVLYSTPVKGDLFVDCITISEMKEESNQIRQYDELTFENIIDSSASIAEKVVNHKYRKLSKAVGTSLKLLYGYRCQICGELVGERYDSHIIHAHHIDYFTRSLNNNSDNILIVCPNHHGIIHDKSPEFDRRKKEFIYPNGYREGLVLNKHL